MEELLAKVRRVLKVVLWTQLLPRRRYDLIVRFYAGLWGSAIAIVGASVAMLLWADRPTRPSFLGVALLASCPVMILVAYAVARFLPWLVVALSVLTPGTLTIAPVIPQAVGNEPSSVAAELPSYLHTGDFWLFTKGSAACLCLMSFTLLLQPLSRLPSSFLRHRHWPLRRAATLVLVFSGLVGLEALRASLRLMPGFRPPWWAALTTFMSEPGWPYALAIWLWLNVAFLLGWYEARLIPYLLRRSGLTWVPMDLSVTESHLVDELLEQFSRSPHSPRRQPVRTLPPDRPPEEKRPMKKLRLKRDHPAAKKPKKKSRRSGRPPRDRWPDELD